MSLRKLFHPSESQEDGFTQSEREAIVDVLHYCMYADRHVAIAEDTMIETVARTLDWDPKISYEYYEGVSTGVVRKALADQESRKAFILSLQQRLKSNDSRSFALRVANDLMKVDGEKTSEEFDMLAELRRSLQY
jgi:hypothetical protein